MTDRLNAEINRIIELPDVKPKLVEAGADVTPISTDAFSAFVKTEAEKFAAIIKEAGIKPE